MSTYWVEKIVVGIIVIIIVGISLTKLITITDNLKAKVEQRDQEIMQLLNN